MDSQVYAAFVGGFIGGLIPVLGLFVQNYFDRKNIIEEYNFNRRKMFEEYNLNREKEAEARQATYNLEREKEEESRKREAARRYIERQMEELYGPLAGLLQQSKDIYEILVERRKVYGKDFSVEDYFTEHYFVPLNHEIFDLLMKKGYLIDSLEPPLSFQEFGKHNTTISVLYSLAKDTGKDSHEVKNVGFPKEFDKDVKNSLNHLRRRYQNYLMQGGILLENNKPHAKS
jgi:hypothetical protein